MKMHQHVHDVDCLFKLSVYINKYCQNAVLTILYMQPLHFYCACQLPCNVRKSKKHLPQYKKVFQIKKWFVLTLGDFPFFLYYYIHGYYNTSPFSHFALACIVTVCPWLVLDYAGKGEVWKERSVTNSIHVQEHLYCTYT